ncbi:MAG: EscU/YscU/HrcU family type III secretion system export apparatus switch protein [Phycisphaerales bacterium]|nr:EscU/YscU/HrcU family type III secretion system export apparatus switch protein [Phycisphaerales bacterium]MCI0631624.1 EscU/YscU/HrcU family type III secretion system export apparatus switch protein [Phycisphaerales bacterium]MCI0674308.1 EscU/YscU/HrcU family type III secretion system export apparatus switch protein [Phycisphaerales bacterium]
MAEDFVERTEPATPRRRKLAREHGQIAKSQDLAGAVMLLLVGIGLWVMMSSVVEQSGELVGDSLRQFGDASAMEKSAGGSIESALAAAIRLGGPIVVVAWIGMMCAHVVQTGLIFTPKSAQPDLGRLNPVHALKRIFSVSGAVRSGMDLAKLAVAIAIGAVFVSEHGREIVSLPYLSGEGAIGRTGSLTLELLLWTVAALMALGALDFGYQRWRVGRDLRMTRQDLNQELRQSESDRENRRRRLQFQRGIASRWGAGAIEGADVLICDDASGIAVALDYDEGGAGLPRVAGKGAGLVAMRLRRVAIEQRMAIVQRPMAARTLYRKVGLGQEIPAELWQEAAEILGGIYARVSRRGDVAGHEHSLGDEVFG